MRRHRLHTWEIPQTIHGLELCLHEHLRYRNNPDVSTGIGLLVEAEKAFKPYFRMREGVTNKPAYPEITWKKIKEYLENQYGL